MTSQAWDRWAADLSQFTMALHQQHAEVSLSAFRAGDKNGAARECARIRRELLAEFGEPGPIEWRQFMKALDRICPEED